MNKKAWIFLILFIISFFASLFLNFYKIQIPYFGAFYKNVQVDVIFNKEPPKVFYDDNEVKNFIKIDENHYLFLSKNFNLFNQIKIEPTENVQKLAAYSANSGEFFEKIPSEIKIDNNKTFLDKLTIGFLSFFYNPQYYLISYIFLFFFLYNFQFKYNKFIFFSLILIGLILRLAQLNNIPFWDDEIYVLVHTALNASWLETLNDPGNPPLYFILFKLYRSIIQNPDFYRISSVIIGVIFNICFYNFLKSRTNKKTALIGLFLATISILLIYFSQELRCYMLLALLAILNSYFLFKYNKKTRFKYIFSTLALLYTHFYGAFYVFANFIFGIILFFRKNKLKTFILDNFICLFVYIPLIIYKKTSLTSDFNTWMSKPDFIGSLSIFQILSSNIIFVILLVVLLGFLFSKMQKRNQLLVKYSFFVIFVVYISSFLFSTFVKPIFFYRYFYIIFPCIITLWAIAIAHPYKNKKLATLALFLILLFKPQIQYQNLFCNHSLFMEFLKHDINKAKKNYVLMPDTVKGYEDFNIENAKNLYLPINKGVTVFDVRQYDIKTPAVVYLFNFYLDDYTLKIAKNIELYKTPLGIFCKIELD